MAYYGRRVDLPDHRDRIFNAENILLGEAAVPGSWDLSPDMPAVYDQGQLGSCSGNGWARVMQYMANIDHDPIGIPSRLFIYYNERQLEGSPLDQDTGAMVRTGAKVVSTIGAPPETDWAYDITQFAARPPAKAYVDAHRHEALLYKRIVIGPGAPMRTAISQGFPIVFGFSVPDYFENGWDFDTPLSLPGPNTQIVGGHCVVVTGYDWTCKHFPEPAFQCDNSWGPDWGLNGRFWMHYRWFDPFPGLANDMWVVQKTS